jgi:hypothetical protein
MLQKKYFLFIILCAVGYSQSVYELLPGSKNNLFELGITAGSNNQTQSARILVQEKPVFFHINFL